MKSVTAVLFISLVVGVFTTRDLRSCNSCGMECENACGTRNFRACCFNYMRKRSGGSEPLPIPSDPSLRLELWLAKSKAPFYQKYFESIPDIPQEENSNK